ncbi:MAG: hypothetical protein AB7U82_27630 [Blastocatellales bacterium]
MPAILTNAQYVEVRAAIGVDISARDLPDRIIKLDLYQGEAERWARKLDVDASTRTGDTLRQLQTAIVLKIASVIIKAMPHLLEESFAVGENSRRQEVDVDARAEELAMRALDTINGYLNPDNVTESALPVFFDKACGRRGQ